MKYYVALFSLLLWYSNGFSQEDTYKKAQNHYSSCKTENCLFQLFLDLKEEYTSDSEKFLNILAYANEQRKFDPKKAFEIIQKRNFQIAKRSAFEQGAYFQTLGAISVISENPAVALKHFKTALRSFNRSKSKFYTAKSYMSIGRTLTAMDSLDSGLMYLHEANSLAENKYPKLELLIKLNKAVNRKMAGDLDEAKQIFSNALEIMTSNSSEAYIICRTEANLAEILMLEENYYAADSLYQKALRRAVSNNLRSDQIRINNDLSRLFERMGEYKTSLFYRHKTDSLRKKARLLAISDQLGHIESQYQLEIVNQQKEHREQLLNNERKITYILTFSLAIVVVLVVLIIRQLLLVRNKNKVLIEKINKKNKKRENKKNTQDLAHLSPLIESLEKVKSNEKVLFDESLTLEKLAKELSTNRSYLSEAINVQFNTTFSKWINQLRIEKACALISDPENDKFSLEAIAKMVGFASISSFNTNFKRITGLTPSYYRNHRLSN